MKWVKVEENVEISVDRKEMLIRIDLTNPKPHPSKKNAIQYASTWKKIPNGFLLQLGVWRMASSRFIRLEREEDQWKS